MSSAAHVSKVAGLLDFEATTDLKSHYLQATRLLSAPGDGPGTVNCFWHNLLVPEKDMKALCLFRAAIFATCHT